MHLTRTSTLSTIVVAATLALSACSSDPEPAQTSPDSAEQSTAVADFNDADVAFVTDMIPHHQEAISMSQMAEDRGGSDVAALATRIEDAQQFEIETMTQWLEDWGQEAPSPMPGTSDLTDMGLMQPGDIDEFMSVRGDEFDTLWLDMMIEHHEGAITMSQTETDQGINPAAVALADDIIEAQQAEITEMNTMLESN